MGCYLAPGQQGSACSSVSPAAVAYNRHPTPLHPLQVVCGALHTLALIDDGTVAAFGDNEFGQTGLESSGTQVWARASHARLLGALAAPDDPAG